MREHPAPPLDSDDTRVMQWLKETAGGGSLMNQSHTRIAVDSIDGRSHLDAALILRWCSEEVRARQDLSTWNAFATIVASLSGTAHLLTSSCSVTPIKRHPFATCL